MCRSARDVLEGPQPVHHVQCGDLVRLRQGRVVEHRVDQVVDGAVAAHDRLADVDQLGGLWAEDVHPEQAAGPVETSSLSMP